jgi:hypothetical protein
MLKQRRTARGFALTSPSPRDTFGVSRRSVLAGGVATLERFPLGLNRDSQGAGKGGVLGGDSVLGMRHDQALFGGFAGACG